MSTSVSSPVREDLLERTERIQSLRGASTRIDPRRELKHRWKAQRRASIVHRPGGVAERLNAPVLKTGRPARVSGVRIPPPPFRESTRAGGCTFTSRGTEDRVMTTTAANANAASGVLGQGRHTYRLVPDWPTLPAGKHFGYTHGVAVDSQGRVIIFNQGPDAVMLFDEAGAFIKSWNRGFEKGAHGLTLNREGGQDFLYLTD